MPSAPDPPARAAAPPVHIRTFGGLFIEIDGAPLRPRGQAQRRPLQLLALLIACGTEGAPERQLCDTLWPDADGDRAHRAYATNLHRLRRLLGHAVLVLRSGRLRLEPAQCWVDAFAFQAALANGQGDRAPAPAEREHALTLYRGVFLDGEPEWPELVAARQRLHDAFAAGSAAAAEAHLAAGRPEAAVALCERGLRVDDACEALARSLMRCHLATERPAEAVAAYERLRTSLLARSGLPPAPETEAAHLEAQEALAQDIPRPAPPSLGVLPFAAHGAEGSRQWLADGFTDNLITHLARLPGLTVVDGCTGSAYRQRSVPVQQAGRELGVRHVLLGTVQHAGRHLRVTARLVETAAGGVTWAEAYDRDADDVLAVQDEIVDGLLTALEVALLEGEQARTVWRHGTSNLQAWELAMRGLAAYRRFTAAGNAEARRLWEAALELDPDYPAALAPLGWTYFAEAHRIHAADPQAALARAEALAERARAIAPDYAPAYLLRAHVRLLQGRFDEVRPDLLRGGELNPNGADTHTIIGSGLGFLGEPEAGLQYVLRGMRLSPFYPQWYLNVAARCHFLAGRPNQALHALRRGSVAWQSRMGRLLRPACHAALDDLPAARAAARGLLRSDPAFTVHDRLWWLLPLRDASARERIGTLLHRAGLP